MYVIARNIDREAQNGLEYLMNETNSNYKFFKSKQDAIEYLKSLLLVPMSEEDLLDCFKILDTKNDFINPEVFVYD
jgi:hypothetical protein